MLREVQCTKRHKFYLLLAAPNPKLQVEYIFAIFSVLLTMTEDYIPSPHTEAETMLVFASWSASGIFFSSYI